MKQDLSARLWRRGTASLPLSLRLLVILLFASRVWAATIHEVVEAGDLEALRSLLRTNAAMVAATNSDGDTPLHVAVSPPNPDMVEVLLAARAPVDALNAARNTPLQWLVLPTAYSVMTNALSMAVGGGNTDLTQFMERAHAKALGRKLTQSETSTLNRLCQAMVALAAKRRGKDEDEIEVAQMLLASGADSNAQYLDGSTVIHLAAARTKTDLLRLLLVPGAKLNAKNALGHTPLIVASLYSVQPAAELLLVNGADANASDRRGNTALHYAVGRADKDMAKCLLDHKALVDRFNNDMETALNYAVRKGEPDLVAILLDRGADVFNRCGRLNETVLHTAVRKGDLPIVQLLLGRNASINVPDSEGFTPLLNAAEDGQMEIVKLLLARGADVNAKTKAGGNVCALAAGSTNIALLSWLFEKQGTNVPDTAMADMALGTAAMHGRLTAVQYLLDHGACANGPVKNPASATSRLFPLHLAAGGPRALLAPFTGRQFAPSTPGTTDDFAQIVSLLLAHGAKVDELGHEGRTPLNIAATFSCLETARILLENKANVRSRSDIGKTPLHQVAVLGDAAIAELLLDHGAELEATDNNRFTPLRDAAASGNRAVVESLLVHKANVGARDRYKATPLHWAAMTTNAAIVAMLLDAGADINALDLGKRTPLHQAAVLGREAVLRLLMERNADATLLDAAAETAADLARKNGFHSIVTILRDSETSRNKGHQTE